MGGFFRKIYRFAVYIPLGECYTTLLCITPSRPLPGTGKREIALEETRQTEAGAPDGGPSAHPLAGLCPRGGERTDRGPGGGAALRRLGQRGRGFPHEVGQADRPGERFHLLQPDFYHPGRLPFGGGGLEGHELPPHRGGQHRHRHRPADQVQADHREADPSLRGQGPHRPGREAHGGPQPRAGAERRHRALLRQPDPGGRRGPFRPGPGERGPHHRRGRRHPQGGGGHAALRQLRDLRPLPGPAHEGGGGVLRREADPGREAGGRGRPVRDDALPECPHPLHRYCPDPHRRRPLL